ncbi:MAG: glycoside hydrolase family protein [Candidatus Sumerlaeota bacterium]|nr:glycoside hydrolase family protein [Candidatus Sumerlaeota bacterium]
MRFMDRIQNPRREQLFTMEGFGIWDPSVIKDEANGKHYLYGSRWPIQYGGYGWLTEGRIFRAEGDSPVGPFTFAEQLDHLVDYDWCRQANHNPKVTKIGDTHCLYYIGTHWEHGDRDPADKASWGRLWRNKRIGVATAPSPKGPWTPSPSNPILDARPDQWDRCLTSNPTVCVARDGRIHLIYKSASNFGQGKLVQNLGLAVADDVHGPYTRAGRSPLLPHNIEDPFVWGEKGCYRLLAKDMTGDVCGVHKAGILYTSTDAVEWELSEERLAYDLWVNWADGSRQEFHKMERPHLYLEDGQSRAIYHGAYAVFGQPTALLARELAP